LEQEIKRSTPIQGLATHAKDSWGATLKGVAGQHEGGTGDLKLQNGERRPEAQEESKKPKTSTLNPSSELRVHLLKKGRPGDKGTKKPKDARRPGGSRVKILLNACCG